MFIAEIQGHKTYSLATIIDLKVEAEFPDIDSLSYCSVTFSKQDILRTAYVMQFNRTEQSHQPQPSQQLRLYLPNPDKQINAQLESASTLKLSTPAFFGQSLSARDDQINIVLCDEAGMGSAIFLAEHYKKKGWSQNTYLFFGAKEKFSFNPVPSKFISPFLPAHVIAAMPLMEDWGILSRLLNSQLPGCFDDNPDLLLSMLVEHICQNQESNISIEFIGFVEFLEQVQFHTNSCRVSLTKTLLVQ